MNLTRTEDKNARKAIRTLSKKAYDEIVRVHGEMSYYSDEMYEPDIEEGGPLFQMYSDYVNQAILEDIELQSAFNNTTLNEHEQLIVKLTAEQLDKSGKRLTKAKSLQGIGQEKEYLSVMGEHVEVDKHSTTWQQAQQYRGDVQQVIFNICEENNVDDYDIFAIAQEAYSKAIIKAVKMAPIHEIKRKAQEIAKKIREKAIDIQQRISPEKGIPQDIALSTDDFAEGHHISR